MGGDILDLYSDYLLASTRKATATGLSELTGGAISHDQITRFLAGAELDGKYLWLKTKKMIRRYENWEGCLIFDDTIVEEDRSANNPAFGRIPIKSATASGNKVTLIVDWDTSALSDNSLICYTGTQPHGERTKEVYGLYCTLLWYRGIDGTIYFGDKDSSEFKANTTGKGYQLRPGPELRLRHFGVVYG
jgi:hypothetical protein